MANSLQAGAGTSVRAYLVSLAAFMLSWLGGVPATAAGPALSDQDRACLACHSQPGFKKELGTGQALSLHIEGEDFAQSVHGAMGCAGCHGEVSLDKHPGTRKIPSARQYSIDAAQVCRGCHEEKFKLYEGSIHATLLRMGNQAAPVCSDCHSPHLVKPKSVTDTLTGLSCRKCHDSVFNAYAESMHGKARGKLGHVSAPICADCHRAHDVSATSAGTRLKEACLGCHAGAADAHRVWLPNAGRHLEAVSCAACHAPAAQRRVELRLHDAATGKRIAQHNGASEFGERARSAGNGNSLDALSLWNILREFNQGENEGKAALQGRLEVRNGIEAHQLADKSKAIRDCASCHRDGADPFQAVTVSIVGPDGRPVRFEVQKEVLSSATSVDSVRGFYAIGGTRVKVLDALLALAFLGGISVPLGHQTLKWLIKRRLRKTEAGSKGRSSDATH